MKKLLLILGALFIAPIAFATSLDFNGTNGTTASSLGFSANTTNDGIAQSTLNGSGFMTNTGSFNYNDAYFAGGGNDSTAKGEIVIPVGTSPFSATNFLHRIFANCRMTTTQLGYQVHLRSSTNNSTADQIYVTRNGTLMTGGQPTLSPTIDTASNAITLSIQVVNTVDIRVIVNGTTYTIAGSGGNDSSGAAVLTGGNSGFSIYNDSATGIASALIDSWTDGVAGGSTVINPISGRGGAAARPVTFNRRAANDDEFLLRASR